MGVYQASIIKFFTWRRWRIFLKQFFPQQYTPANLNFCWLLKPFFKVPNALINTWLKKAFAYCPCDNSTIPCLKTFLLGHHELECCTSSFAIIAYVSVRRAVIIDYLFYFHILYLMEKWSCKQVYWNTNSFLPLPCEPCNISCVRIVHHTSSILVKIMHLIHLLFHMLTLKALT